MDARKYSVKGSRAAPPVIHAARVVRCTDELERRPNGRGFETPVRTCTELMPSTNHRPGGVRPSTVWLPRFVA
jgi:hypothetical protein